MKVIKIPVNEKPTVEEVDYEEFNGSPESTANKFIDGWGEIVSTVFVEAGIVLLVNEDGRLKQLPINNIASAIYGFNAEHPNMLVVGNAWAIHLKLLEDGDVDFDDGDWARLRSTRPSDRFKLFMLDS